MEVRRQRPHRARERPGVVILEQQHFRIRCRRRVPAAVLAVERLPAHPEGVAAEAGARIPDDPEKPGAAVPAAEGSEVTKRPQRRLLYGVVRIFFIAHEPAREAACGVEMRQDDLVEALACHGVSVERGRNRRHQQHSHGARTSPVRLPDRLDGMPRGPQRTYVAVSSMSLSRDSMDAPRPAA